MPYTRIVEWGKAYRRLLNYIMINDLESYGFEFVDRKVWVLDTCTPHGFVDARRQLELF